MESSESCTELMKQAEHCGLVYPVTPNSTRLVAGFVVESSAVFGSAEVALGQSPVADGFGNASHELADAGLALRGTDLSVKIFAGNDIGRGYGPVFGDLDVCLLEDDSALRVGDLRQTLFPFDFVIRRDARLSKEAADGQAGSFLLRG